MSHAIPFDLDRCTCWKEISGRRRRKWQDNIKTDLK